MGKGCSNEQLEILSQSKTCKPKRKQPAHLLLWMELEPIELITQNNMHTYITLMTG